MHLEDARGERVLDGVVDLLAGHATRERPDGDRDLLLLGLRHRVHEPGRALDRRVLAVEAADHLDVVLELRRLADARLADDVALPVLDGVAAEGMNLEGAADTNSIRIGQSLIEQLNTLSFESLCKRLERNALRSLVSEIGRHMPVACLKMFEDSRNQALPRYIRSDPRSVTGNPAAPKSLRAECSCARPTGRVKYQISRLCGHQNAPFNHRLGCLDHVVPYAPNLHTFPPVIYRNVVKIISVTLVRDGISLN